MSLVSSDDISFFFILGLIGNVMTTLIPMAIPISIFFSSIFCLSRMSGDSEYVALRAAGLEKYKILAPFMLVAFVISISVFLLTQELVPNAHRKVRTKIKIISSTSLIQGLKSGQFFTNLPNVTIFPVEVNEQTKEMTDIFLHIYDTNNQLEKIIVAEKGKVLHSKDEKSGVESFKLLLNDGNIVNKDAQGSDLEKILFEEYLLPISEKRFSYQTSVKEIMMNRSELSSFINGGLEEAKKQGFNKKEFLNAKYEFWNRVNTPLLCLLLTFVGFGLGVTGNRGRSKNSSGKAIIILIGYYLIYFTIVSASRDDTLPVVLCVVIPNLLLLGVGIKNYKNIDWLS